MKYYGKRDIVTSVILYIMTVLTILFVPLSGTQVFNTFYDQTKGQSNTGQMIGVAVGTTLALVAIIVVAIFAIILIVFTVLDLIWHDKYAKSIKYNYIRYSYTLKIIAFAATCLMSGIGAKDSIHNLKSFVPDLICFVLYLVMVVLLIKDMSNITELESKIS